MYEPPPGFDDMLSDAETVPSPDSFHPLQVDDVGVVSARKPMPNAVPAVAMATNSKISPQSRLDYLVLFVRNHLAPGEYERVACEMITGSFPPDSVERIARAVATWGTARPTSPSAH